MDRHRLELLVKRAELNAEIARAECDLAVAKLTAAEEQAALSATAGVDVQRDGLHVETPGGVSRTAMETLTAACTDKDGVLDADLIEVLKMRAVLESLVEYLGPDRAAEVAKDILTADK